MSTIKFEKYLDSPPEEIRPNTVYFIRKDGGFNIMLSDKDGSLILNQNTNTVSDQELQPSLFNSHVGQLIPIPAVATPSIIGISGSVTGKFTARALSADNYLSQLIRTGLVSSISKGSRAGWRSSTAAWMINNSSKMGGFFFCCRFGIPAINTTGRWFVGMSSDIAAPSNINPNTTYNTIGIGGVNGYDNIQLFSSDSNSFFQRDLGIDFPARTINSVYELRISVAAGSNNVNISLKRLDIDAYYEILNIPIYPDVGELIAPKLWISNTNDPVIVALDLCSFYISNNR